MTSEDGFDPTEGDPDFVLIQSLECSYEYEDGSMVQVSAVEHTLADLKRREKEQNQVLDLGLRYAYESVPDLGPRVVRELISDRFDVYYGCIYYLPTRKGYLMIEADPPPSSSSEEACQRARRAMAAATYA